MIFFTLTVVFVVGLSLNVSLAVSGPSVHVVGSKQQVELSIEGLTNAQVVSTPVRQLDDVLGRQLMRAEKISARKIKRSLKDPKRPRKPSI